MLGMKYIPVSLVLICLAAAYYFGLTQYLQFDTFKTYHYLLLQWRDQHYTLSILLYCLIYIICTAISIPGGLIFTLAGGFLFGLVTGTICVILSATVGATLIFLAVKYAFSNWLSSWLTHKSAPWVKRMAVGFKRNEFSYLLFLRLIPLFPFWIVNIVPALLNVRIKTFISATFIGIIPGTFIYISVGNGLNKIFEAGGTPDFSIIFTPAVLFPLLGLAGLSLLPVLYRLYTKRHSAIN
jgi:uncharacterized membrane protein YdjX (TVP38/TMEM64 family)